jgi:Predicted membrane protein (DUF2207) C-terminal domain/Predicted membrane protein (DUF2207) N-terminal domain
MTSRNAFLLFMLAGMPAPALAQRSLAIERFDASITVNPDASIDVVESITARFTGSWNGIYRTIPVVYHTPQGFNWTLRLALQGATLGPGGPALRVESARERHYIKYKIWVPGAQDATHTVVFRYRARNGLRFFADHDELYWNVTGDEWDVPIDAATARIELPPEATGVRATAFNGVYGATARDARVDIEGSTVRLAMPAGLGFHEGLTGVVGWDKGAVTEPTKTERAAGFLVSNWPLGIPLVVFTLTFWLWYRVGRDPQRLPVAVQYEPGDGLTPAEAGTLMDDSADMRDITATIVDLAVRGYLRIEEREKDLLFGLIKRREYVFHRLDGPPNGPRLEPHESGILAGVFPGGVAERELSDLENEFYQRLPGIRDSIFARLAERGLYRWRPDRVRTRWTRGAVVVGGGLVALGAAVAPRLNLTPLPFLVAGALSGLIVALFGRIMPARTVAGARARERVLGFEEFLRRVEEPTFARMRTPEMFERFLSYAMAFRVERKWTKAFENIYREPPRWYVGGNGDSFTLRHFSGRLSDLSSRTSSTMASSPRSSGGSGFGGGSSGGGGGGGGGGGF